MTWLHVTNNTGTTLVVYFVRSRVEVPPGQWCCSSKPPHCTPKERP